MIRRSVLTGDGQVLSVFVFEYGEVVGGAWYKQPWSILATIVLNLSSRPFRVDAESCVILWRVAADPLSSRGQVRFDS